jgi:hypothetical protein
MKPYLSYSAFALLASLAAPAYSESLPETVSRHENEISALKSDIEALKQRGSPPSKPAAGPVDPVQIFISKGTPFVLDTPFLRPAPVVSGCKFRIESVTVDELQVLDEKTDIRRVIVSSKDPTVISARSAYDCNTTAVPVAYCSYSDVIQFQNGQRYEIFVQPGRSPEDCRTVITLRRP